MKSAYRLFYMFLYFLILNGSDSETQLLISALCAKIYDTPTKKEPFREGEKHKPFFPSLLS